MADTGVPRQLGNQMCKIAELPQKRELSRRWIALSLVFYSSPGGRVQALSANFFTHNLQLPRKPE
jgi:hypothetical protein